MVLPTILKLIPVKIGLDSSVEDANDVWEIIPLKSRPAKIKGFLLNSKLIAGYSFLSIPFKLNSLLSV